MKRNSNLVIWLALIMLLLVSAAAIVFLAQRNSQLEEDLQVSGEGAELGRAALVATSDALSSDVAVRQAALNAAVATRDSLAAEAELATNRGRALESSLLQKEESLANAQATLQALSLQVFLIAPADGVTVPPLVPLNIMATARSDAALNLLALTVNDQQVAQVPGEGLNTINVRAEWTPPEEDTYVISVEAFTADGHSETAEVTIEAAFASEQARDNALSDQLEEAAALLRFPNPPSATTADVEVAAEAAVAGSGDVLLHRLLLTGRIADDEAAVADEAFALEALDLIISDAAYRTYLDSVVTADLLAYFDPDSAVLTVYQPGEQSGAFRRWLAIHGLAHDLQTEQLGLDEMDIATLDGDRRMALRALVEGDAVFLQHLALAGETMPVDEAAEVRAGLSDTATDSIAALPTTLQELYTFAYSSGVPFIQALYDQDGYDTVNGAWRVLPVSSEQIIHPESYLTLDNPRPVTLIPLTDLQGQGWRLVADDTFGEFLLRQHLGRQPLPSVQIDLASTGWGGGRYAVYQSQDGASALVVFRLAWDSIEDANQFAEAYADYLGRRYGGDQVAVDGGGRCWSAGDPATEVSCLYQPGEESLVIRAPNLDLARAAAEVQLNMSQ
jgi:hypothetical protein